MTRALEGKSALITGGTSGIGRAAALEFARQGARVVVSGRREDQGAGTVRLVQQAGGEAHFVRADVSVEDDVRRLVDATVARFGRLDIAFNNAGIEQSPMAPVTQTTVEQYRQIFDINVLGVLLSLKHEIPAMLANGGGAIVNTTSVAGHVGMANAATYIAAKHAVEGLTKSAALEVARQNIRINAVAPAAIVTDMIDRFAGGAQSDAGKYIASLHPIGRMGQPDEIARAAAFLLSDASSFVTGTSLLVDGGWTAQ